MNWFYLAYVAISRLVITTLYLNKIAFGFNINVKSVLIFRVRAVGGVRLAFKADRRSDRTTSSSRRMTRLIEKSDPRERAAGGQMRTAYEHNTRNNTEGSDQVSGRLAQGEERA